MSFALSLTKVVADQQKEENRRAEVAKAWEVHEASLLESAVETFQKHCTKAAEAQKPEVTVSFEALTKEIPEFPKRILDDAFYYVDKWTGGVTAESWFYSNNGTGVSYTGTPILFAELLERMLAQFLKKVQSLGFSSCQREEGTWKVTVLWGMPDSDELPSRGARKRSFPVQLKYVMLEAQEEKRQRAKSAKAWELHEATLLDRAVEVFRKRCTQAAESQKSQTTVSFEVLSRDLKAFPTRILTDSTYYVDTWAEGVTAESWFYACRGTDLGYTGSPILFAEMLDRMLTKFMCKVETLGFSSCQREVGTWKVTAVWGMPEKDQRPLKFLLERGGAFAAQLQNVILEKQTEQRQREELASVWKVQESLLLDRALELFQKDCTRAAERKKDQATVSFETLSRGILGFPIRTLRDGTYYVDQWSQGTTAESWFYGNKGIKLGYDGSPILFAEMLDRMFAKFMEKSQALGFSSCKREAGTWKVTAVWSTPEKHEQASKRAGDMPEDETSTKRARKATRAGGA